MIVLKISPPLAYYNNYKYNRTNTLLNPLEGFSTLLNLLKSAVFAIFRYLIIIVVLITAFYIYSDQLIRDPNVGKVTSYTVYRFNSDINIQSPNAILINNENSEVVFSKESDAIVYPASLTKMLTCIVAIENLDDLEKTFTITSGIWDIIYTQDASHAGFQANEKVKYIDLLYGLMLESGADCSIGLAQAVAGSERAFADLMNAKAAEIGMSSSHFVNSTGLHHDNQYSTVSDLSKLLQYAIKNELFVQLVTTPVHVSSPTNIHPEGLKLESHLLAGASNRNMGGIVFRGGKTGFTEEANYCLASFADKYEDTFILVTCGAPEDPNNKRNMIYLSDAFLVYNAIYTIQID